MENFKRIKLLSLLFIVFNMLAGVSISIANEDIETPDLLESEFDKDTKSSKKQQKTSRDNRPIRSSDLLQETPDPLVREKAKSSSGASKPLFEQAPESERDDNQITPDPLLDSVGE